MKELQFHLTRHIRMAYIGMTYKRKVFTYLLTTHTSIVPKGVRYAQDTFTPAMIETFRSCQKAYELASIKFTNGGAPVRASVICKKFILRALAEINRGKLDSVNQVQKYMGQNWPVEKLEDQIGEKEKATRAF